ncbi:hypothetical protein [Cellulosimicrobium arenosum]|uniref:Uncharacterized protein n=1 Tax=Cellulosimicrobium arenosum TaxID=2708133 RepID=A0A927G8P1_9MICO|nr:hypothetical protein [Cellulosimicrobium arenosum]MBD8078477.1 hypothetical protein [Cellulosimicrobium arenosum]
MSVRQVENLVAHGKLTSPARGLIDPSSVDRFVVLHGRSRSRPWSMPTAWGAVALLSGAAAAWMGQSQRSRLKGRLREASADAVVAQTRARAATARYAGHPSAVTRLRAEIVDTGATSTRLGLTPSADVDGYVNDEALPELTRRFALVRDDSGQFTLRATTFPIEVVSELAAGADVLAALDLAESLDVRERQTGLGALAAALEALHG